ncbi:hypothetical protein BGW80DRAFT_1348870, partial [Lactifluus volemus]
LLATPPASSPPCITTLTTASCRTFRRHLRPSAVRSATRLASRPRCTPLGQLTDKIKEFEAKVASKLLTPAQQPRTILIVAPGGGMVRDQLENNQASPQAEKFDAMPRLGSAFIYLTVDLR